MKKWLSVFTILIFTFNTVFCQRISYNGYESGIDEPFQFNKELIKGKYRLINIYSCSDTIFKKSKCVCESRELYNDSGRIIKLIVGSDLDSNKINYIVNFTSTTDSICQVTAEFFAQYIDRLSLFQDYDTIQNKAFFIYPRDPKTKNVKIRSTLLYPTRRYLPDTIFRYDITGKLKEIYYPNGNRKILKEWSDSLINRDSKTFYFHSIFPENQYHSYATYSKKGIILDRGWTNISNDSTANTQKTIYIYDDSLRLILKNTVDEKNSFIESEHFFYDSGILTKHTIDRNLNDSVDNEIKIYNKDGKLLELFQKAANYPYDTWKWLYIYQGHLQHRTDYFRTGKYQGSTFFIYSSS